MDEFTAAEAAKWLDISRESVDLAAREGRLAALDGEGPRRFSRDAVEGYHQLKQDALVASLARSHETPVSVAARVRRALHSSSDTGLPRSLASKLGVMPESWRVLFNRAELAAASVPDGQGCRWCRAVEFSSVLGLRPVEFAPARVELFGGEPCEVCGPVLLRPFMEALAARVHRGAVRPPARPSPPSEAERQAAAEWASQRAVTASADPVRDDGGRALVAARLREVRARAKAAKRSGDQKYALKLAQMARALEKDAAVVDGRVTAAARPGRLRCGHLLSARCTCPRRASSRRPGVLDATFEDLAAMEAQTEHYAAAMALIRQWMPAEDERRLGSVLKVIPARVAHKITDHLRAAGVLSEPRVHR